MAAPKPIIVPGESCGHPDYIQGGKDVRAVSGGGKDDAIKTAKTNAQCPYGIESSTVIEPSYPFTTTIPNEIDNYDAKEKIYGSVSIRQQCWHVTLSVVCADLADYKAKLSLPQPVAPVAPSQPSTSSSTVIPHERNAVELPRGTHPIKDPQKGVK